MRAILCDIPTTLDNLEDLRQFHRERVAAKGGGIIELDTIAIDSIVVLK